MSKSQKGSAFERQMAKFLTQWLTGQKKEYYFWRSPGSGSIYTRMNENENLSGDIIAIRPEADFFVKIFSIELKNGYPKASIDQHLKYNKNNHIQDFWTQTNKDCEKNKKNPMLIYKKLGFKGPWLGINEKCKDKFYKYLVNDRFIHLKWDDLPDVYFYEMNRFFETLTPGIIKEIFNV